MLGGAAWAPKQRLPALPGALANACRQRLWESPRDTLSRPANPWKNRGAADLGVSSSPPTSGFFLEALFTSKNYPGNYRRTCSKIARGTQLVLSSPRGGAYGRVSDPRKRASSALAGA